MATFLSVSLIRKELLEYFWVLYVARQCSNVRVSCRNYNAVGALADAFEINVTPINLECSAWYT